MCVRARVFVCNNKYDETDVSLFLFFIEIWRETGNGAKYPYFYTHVCKGRVHGVLRTTLVL